MNHPSFEPSSPRPPARARVCVIGAGLSGLVATKELVEAGVEVECFDMMPVLGGTFSSFVWKGGRLTSSTVSTWFSDFPVADRQRFMTWAEFVAYLEAYVDHFGFRDRIELDTKVESVEDLGERGWRVQVRRGDYSNGHPSHPQRGPIESERSVREYSHLIIANGLNHTPKIAEIPGLDSFPGRVLHSREYRDAEDFRGQRVLVVGAGESGSDIIAQVAAVARASTISMRRAPGTLFPKWIQGNTPDIRDDRLTYNLPRTFSPIIRRGHRRFYSVQAETPELFEWAARSNWESKNCSFSSQACKSFGIPEAVVHHGATARPEPVQIDGAEVEFADGSVDSFDAIIFATGFRVVFPMLPPELGRRLAPVNGLWKHAVHPDIGSRLMLVGFARPHQINFLSTSELQARMAALVISGARSLPSPDQMRIEIAADQTFMRRYYGEGYRRNPGLVDQLYYTDSLAAFVGCQVPWAEVARRDPKLALMLVYAALSGAHHRLAGPGANWEVAARAIKATPLFRNRANAVFRWAVLSGLTIGAQLGGRFDARLQPIGQLIRKNSK